jgi:hypothetical protein
LAIDKRKLVILFTKQHKNSGGGGDNGEDLDMG